jgi:replication-associated recombination protein RarA
MTPTVGGLEPFECLSALQKCIRRGHEREAMEFAVELIHTSKAYCSMVANRLELIAHEDIGLADPQAVVFTATACEQARRFYDPDQLAKSRMILGNVIRYLCRANKSREGDHFQAACGLNALLNGYVPNVPDVAHDMHTAKGRRMGRGVDHFMEEGTKLSPVAATHTDPYRDEAAQLWHKKHGTRAANEPGGTATRLF